ncbi:hypothetical protein ACF0H5_012213 [Mactra antiquata]
MTKYFVTVDTFDPSKLEVKELMSLEGNIKYKIYLTYTYGNGLKKPLLIKTHPLFSFGLFKNGDDKRTTVYAIDLNVYDSDIRKTEKD